MDDNSVDDSLLGLTSMAILSWFGACLQAREGFWKQPVMCYAHYKAQVETPRTLTSGSILSLGHIENIVKEAFLFIYIYIHMSLYLHQTYTAGEGTCQKEICKSISKP